MESMLKVLPITKLSALWKVPSNILTSVTLFFTFLLYLTWIVQIHLNKHLNAFACKLEDLFLPSAAESLSALQLIQNAAVRILTGVRKREHIEPIPSLLHC